MNSLELSVLMLLISGTLHAQTDNCFEKATGSFWPIKSAPTVKFASQGASYTSYFNGDSLEANGKYFHKNIHKYVNGKTTNSYWRAENGFVYHYDTAAKAESIELVNNLTPGTTWEKYDKTWKYTIIDTVSSFSTMFCDFKGLLQVKAEPQNELKGKMSSYYNLFYKRGVGMIGLSIEGRLFTFALPNRELNERNFMAYGCEKFTSKEQAQKCTYTSIMNFFSKEFKAPNAKNYKSGKMRFNVTLGIDGKVESVQVLETLEGAQLQEKEAIRVIRMLPKMIPGQVDDGQPIRTSFVFPVSF